MNNEINYGLYSGLAFSIYVLIEHVLGFNSSKIEIGQYTQMLAGAIPFIFIFLGIRNRKLNQQNVLSLTQGVRSGMVISLVSSVLISVFLMLYVRYILPDMASYIQHFQKAKLEAMHATPDQIKMQMDDTAKMYDGSFGSHVSLAAFFTSVGIVVSLICSLILKKKKNEFEV